MSTTTAQSKRQKLSNSSSLANADPSEFKETSLQTDELTETVTANAKTGNQDTFGVDIDDLDDDTDSDENDDDDDEDEDEDEESLNNGNNVASATANGSSSLRLHGGDDIQAQLAAAGPAGVAAAAAIATARKRKRAHQFETNPSVRKRQQTRLIRKLRACLDEYTMRVGQQAVVLITMPGKSANNFKVFGAQPLENVIRSCKQDIMTELEQALLEQAPKQFKVVDSDRHELPPLVIDGIPTPVEKMTQAQLRAFIPLMLKYSTGRGKPGWGKDSTRPPWWPETLPWANVRSDARDENEKQRISWTTTLRQIVTNCYKFHGRDDLLPKFDESEESLKAQLEAEHLGEPTKRQQATSGDSLSSMQTARRRAVKIESPAAANIINNQTTDQMTAVYTTAPAYATANHFVHTIANEDGTVSLIQVDPADAQILTLPDGTQVRAVRLQTLTGTDQLCATSNTSGQLIDPNQQQQQDDPGQMQQEHQQITLTEASLSADGQIILTGEDGIQSCYPMSSLVSIPASMYQQFTGTTDQEQQQHQQINLVSADGSTLTDITIQQHQTTEQSTSQEEQQGNSDDHQQVNLVDSSSAEQHFQIVSASDGQEQIRSSGVDSKDHEHNVVKTNDQDSTNLH